MRCAASALPCDATSRQVGSRLAREGAACLNAGANDLGGTLMNESISAPQVSHGQEFLPEAIEALIAGLAACAAKIDPVRKRFEERELAGRSALYHAPVQPASKYAHGVAAE